MSRAERLTNEEINSSLMVPTHGKHTKVYQSSVLPFSSLLKKSIAEKTGSIRQSNNTQGSTNMSLKVKTQ